MMSLHKLTAGDGYMYLIRQVAAADDTARGRGALGDYYSSKGETPGRWMGSGLAALSEPRGLAAAAGDDPWTVAPGQHHFDVIDDLVRPDSPLMDALLGGV